MNPHSFPPITSWHVRAIVGLTIILAIFGIYSLVYAERILPRITIGDLAVGGMTREQAEGLVRERFEVLQKKGIVIAVDGKTQVIRPENIDLTVVPAEVVDQAWLIGRTGSWYDRIGQQLTASVVRTQIVPRYSFDAEALANELELVAGTISQPSKDVRLVIRGARVDISYEIKDGLVLDQALAYTAVLEALKKLSHEDIKIQLRPEIPHIRPESAPAAKRQAEAMMKKSIALTHDWQTFVISREQIGKWILSKEDAFSLRPELDTLAIRSYVTTIANALNVAAQKPTIQIEEGKVTHFVPPRTGLALEEEQTFDLIIKELEGRRDGSQGVATLALPVKITKPTFDSVATLQGISELIGKATTPFTGSPANRVSNIKNGAKFLSGVIIQPGEEFSTLKTLGTVDNTTGYLPELVIKESETIPEFGGGLCQVSTTLFRAALNAGLPITARRNHSFRVHYYEKDAAGNFIGPGLDATIYDGGPDFRFKNDTAAPILIYGYVDKDRLTFEFYGTSDGRTASVTGPTLLSEIPAGEPIYRDTDQLPQGVVKQKEIARPGGTTTAVYTVVYPDGRQKKEEFRSFYKRWPAQYLVGVAPSGSE